MKNRFRTLTAFLLALLLTASLAPAALAEEEPLSAKLDLTLTWDAGNQAYIASVSISEHPGFAGFAITLLYDENKLEYVEDSAEFGFTGSGTYTTVNPDTPGRIRFVRAGGENETEDGKLFSAAFKVSEAGSLAGQVSVSIEENTLEIGTDDYRDVFPSEDSVLAAEAGAEFSLSLSGGRVTGSVTAEFTAEGYSDIKGALACYDGGQLCAFMLSPATAAGEISFNNLNISVKGGAEIKLFFLSSDFSPLAPALEYTLS